MPDTLPQAITAQSPIRFQDTLPDAADVAIIGGGVIGIFSGLFMARAGLSVVVVEKGRVAGEQSSRNWGWIRQNGRDPDEIPIVMEASRTWEAIDQEVNGRTGFVRGGLAYVASSEAAHEKNMRWLETARQFGLDSHALNRADISKLFHGLPSTHRWISGSYTPSDARAEPWQAVPAVAELAQSEGVRIRENCAVRALDTQAGVLQGIITEHGPIKAAQVVLAAGAWSSLFLKHHGISIPQLTVRASVARTHPLDEIYPGGAADEQLAFRRRIDGGYSLALTDRIEHIVGPDSFRHALLWRHTLKASHGEFKLRAPYSSEAWRLHPNAWGRPRTWDADRVTPFERLRVLDPPPSPNIAETMASRFAERFPKLGTVRIRNAWAGMIDSMPDVVPIIDRAPHLDGLLIATGMSGHGFGIGPGVAGIVSDLAEGKPPKHDLQRFRFSRFTDGSPLKVGPSI